MEIKGKVALVEGVVIFFAGLDIEQKSSFLDGHALGLLSKKFYLF